MPRQDTQDNTERNLAIARRMLCNDDITITAFFRLCDAIRDNNGSYPYYTPEGGAFVWFDGQPYTAQGWNSYVADLRAAAIAADDLLIDGPADH